MAHHLYRKFLHWTRTLHTYATMLALILIVFFSFTGIVLNHPVWFNIIDADHVIDQKAASSMPADILGGKGDGNSRHAMDVEVYLRMHEGARGERTSFEDQEDIVRLQFTGAGHTMEYTIAKADGNITEHFEIRNAMALVGDLHKGNKGTGSAWSIFIDATAIFLLFSSVTGVILWLSLPKRRTLGLVALAASIILCGWCYLFLLP